MFIGAHEDVGFQDCLCVEGDREGFEIGIYLGRFLNYQVRFGPVVGVVGVFLNKKIR
jgi:hypothetical protein